MFTLLTLDAARDSVARQFGYDEPQPAADSTIPTRTTPVPRRARRSHPLRALLGHTGGMATRATWSPTR